MYQIVGGEGYIIGFPYAGGGGGGGARIFDLALPDFSETCGYMQ